MEAVQLAKKAVIRAGVKFDCPKCELLLKDDREHETLLPKLCPECNGDLKLVATAAVASLVGDAKWFRCLSCKLLLMQRRNEMVATSPRSGFKEFTEF